LEIDLQKGAYRIFRSFLNRKSGNWKPLSSFEAQIILKKDGGINLVGPRPGFGTYISKVEYQVFLTDQTHRKRLYLAHFDSWGEAADYAKGFKQKTGIP